MPSYCVKGSRPRDWRDVSATKSTDVLARDPGLVSSIHGSSQPVIITDPVDLTPSFGLCRHYIHVCVHTCRQRCVYRDRWNPFLLYSKLLREWLILTTLFHFLLFLQRLQHDFLSPIFSWLHRLHHSHAKRLCLSWSLP